MGPNLNIYLQKLSTFVEETEQVGEKMNPDYEKVRTAIDEKKTTELSRDDLKAVYDVFAAGVADYVGYQASLTAMRAPAKVIGIHKRLEKTFAKYLAGCQAMLESVDGKLDVEQFEAAEKEQDEASNGISFCVQRIMQLVK